MEFCLKPCRKLANKKERKTNEAFLQKALYRCTTPQNHRMANATHLPFLNSNLAGFSWGIEMLAG